MSLTQAPINQTVQNNKDADDLKDVLKDHQLLKSRSIFLSEAVTSETAKKVVSDLLVLDQEKKPIYFYVNSPGGEVNSGFAIYDVIRFLQSEVYIINVGLCASIATIINIAVEPKRRFSLPNTRYLIHQPLISGQIQAPTTDLEIHANQILLTRERINKLLAEACKQDFERIQEDTNRDYWMTAQEALDYGLIGKIIDHKKELK